VEKDIGFVKNIAPFENQIKLIFKKLAAGYHKNRMSIYEEIAEYKIFLSDNTSIEAVSYEILSLCGDKTIYNDSL
jgi:hypothetical protein